MGTIHISEADATANFAVLMAHIRAGEEVVIERNSEPVAILAPVPERPRTATQILARLQQREQETGKPLRLGADFADDLEEIVANRQSANTREHRSASETLARIRHRVRELGFMPVMGKDFADAVEERVERRGPRDTSAWDLVLDSDILIAADRRGETIDKLMERILETWNDSDVAISVITALELTHGLLRTRNGYERLRSETFLNLILEAVIVKPVTLSSRNVPALSKESRLREESSSRLKTSLSARPRLNREMLSLPPIFDT